jgi:mevalonate pyrophosphate decarboxylase
MGKRSSTAAGAAIGAAAKKAKTADTDAPTISN